MHDKLPTETRDVLAAARVAALNLGHGEVRPAHLFVGLFAAPQTHSAVTVLSHGLNASTVEARLSALLPPGSVAPGSSLFSPALQKILSSATRAAQMRDHSGTLSVDTLAAALFAANDDMVNKVLEVAQTTSHAVLAELDADIRPSENLAGTLRTPAQHHGDLAGPGPGSGTRAAEGSKNLTAFTRDLTAAAAAGELDPVIGRDTELARVSVILCRRTKNNPVLVGEPGVGKTAVVEALAASIAAGTAAGPLLGKRLVSVDLSAMVAGARFRGDFEERIKDMLKEVQNDGNIILFLDEIHQLVGAGGNSGAMDAANILKEYLARGTLSLIGATTTEEYRTHIEKDAALERRFQPVQVAEPDEATTAAILTQLAPVYGAHHKLTYTPAAIEQAAKLAGKYIRDRQNPDKAIDVLDEAGSRVAMARMKAKGRCSELSVVDVDTVCDVVSAISGVPVAALTQVETTRLLELGTRLAQRVIGQAAAVDAVARAVRRRRSGIDAAKRPSSFVFAGPTGVGKTELARALADELFATQNVDAAKARGELIQFDMSEFGEKHTVARLIGAPPGYVGFESGGQLTEAVRRQPYSVVLLDEIEKAHVDIFDVLLQVLEDGHLTDGQGRKVDFRHVVLILTTNLGAKEASRTSPGFGPAAAASSSNGDAVRRAVKDAFRPEFVNRIDEVVVFDRLGRDQLELVIDGLLAPLRAQLAERDITLELTAAATNQLLAAGYDPLLGARPLRRAITALLSDPLSDALILGAVKPGDHVLADAGPGTCVVTVTASASAVTVRALQAQPV